MAKTIRKRVTTEEWIEDQDEHDALGDTEDEPGDSEPVVEDDDDEEPGHSRRRRR